MTAETDDRLAGTRIGRYALYDAIASGGMATVHLGRLLGPVGFSRTVAIKRLHRQFAKDPSFLAMFVDEARLAAQVRHPNVVSTLDVVATDGELFLVMDYVEGESLARLLKRASADVDAVPVPIASSIVLGLLYGLHAAHEAKNEGGSPLGIVHRDVSPQNVLVGIDGISRVADFGVAKAARRIQETDVGHLKGKIAYMAPEQVTLGEVGRRADVWASGVVLWETLAGRRLFRGDNAFDVVRRIKSEEIPPPSTLRPNVPQELDDLVARALNRDPERRYPSCREFAIDLEEAAPPAVQRIVGEWVEQLARESLDKRARLLTEVETGARSTAGDPVDLARFLDPSANHSATSLLGEPLPPIEPGSSTLTTPVSLPRPAQPADIESGSTKASWDASPTPPRPRPRAALVGVGIGAVAFGAALAAVLVLRSTTPDPVGPARRGLGIAPRVPRPSVPATAEAPDPVVDGAATPEPAPPAMPVPPVRAPLGTTRGKLVGNCDPPYVRGLDGITRFKKECLK